MITLALDRENWDLCLDSSNNIAVASDVYAKLQDAASYARVIVGDAWFDVDRGIPYFDEASVSEYPVALLRSKLAEEAQRVPGVARADIALALPVDRAIEGLIQITVGDAVATAQF